MADVECSAAPGEVGSWTRLPAGQLGQVWAIIAGGRDARVWVADGARYHVVAVADLLAEAGGNSRVIPTPSPPVPEMALW